LGSCGCGEKKDGLWDNAKKLMVCARLPVVWTRSLWWGRLFPDDISIYIHFQDPLSPSLSEAAIHLWRSMVRRTLLLPLLPFCSFQQTHTLARSLIYLYPPKANFPRQKTPSPTQHTYSSIPTIPSLKIQSRCAANHPTIRCVLSDSSSERNTNSRQQATIIRCLVLSWEPEARGLHELRAAPKGTGKGESAACFNKGTYHT
jgi:hypothetical protein